MKVTTIEQSEKLGYFTYQYANGDWDYKDQEGNYHLIRKGIELTAGVVAKNVHSYSNGDWHYVDKQGGYHFFDKNNNKIGE